MRSQVPPSMPNQAEAEAPVEPDGVGGERPGDSGESSLLNKTKQGRDRWRSQNSPWKMLLTSPSAQTAPAQFSIAVCCVLKTLPAAC